MAIPTYDKIMLPLLKVIKDGAIYKNQECIDVLAIEFNLSEEDCAQRLPSGKNIFYDRVNWAKGYLKNAGLVEVPSRGQFRITERGKKILESNIEELGINDLLKYEEFRDYLRRSNRKINEHQEASNSTSKEINKEIDKTPQEYMEQAFQEIKMNLVSEVLDRVKEMNCYRFEDLVLDLLVKMGYGGSREEAKLSTKKSGDEGIDGIINEDRLGLDRIYVQAKRWKDGTVGRPEIQKFSGALDGPGATKGIFITTTSFTKEAIEYSRGLSSKKIILIDGKLLASLMVDFNVGVSVENTYEVKRIDTDYFIEE